MGPVAGRKQFDTVRGYIQVGLDEGARLVAGGLERPDGLDKGFFVRPTVFADVAPDMRVFQEEIFGPVLCITPFRDEAHAIELANATEFGLSGYVQSADVERARRVAGRMRTGMVHLNGAPTDGRAPFGGYRQSGNGREWGRFGLEDFLEVKSVMGWEPRRAEPSASSAGRATGPRASARACSRSPPPVTSRRRSSRPRSRGAPGTP